MAQAAFQVTVGIPVFNEEANLRGLLQHLAAQPEVSEIIAVDDCSTDTSADILREFARVEPRLRVFHPQERGGQLAAWIRIAQESRNEKIVFIDADALPVSGAAGALCQRLDERTVIASGRVHAANPPKRFPAARFRANVLHRVRSLGFPKEAIIGRFFAVRRDWFLKNVGATDIIANDAYLGCLARRQGYNAVYEPAAACLYTEATATRDFAAQRQRADAGYAQLRSLGIMQTGDEPSFRQYLGSVARELAADPSGGMHWIVQQLRSRRMRAYIPQGRDLGGWETQPTTKQRLQ
ncbi:MAG TPA: glycosyltransferase [Candidatus Baltobacteraceae bacterium]|nr:glycosyltransferase [Candidatus Baltobacteraceae bacterium]